MGHHVIYIPGLGDHYSYGQDIAIKLWRVFGLHSHYLALGWRNSEGFNSKLERLTDKIDALMAKGHRVSLCGTSAGASAVIAAYSARPNINGVVTIAGKIHHPETIGQKTRDENPDFYEAACLIKANSEVLSQRNDTKNILCLYAKRDKTVPPEDAIILGSRDHRVPGWDHGSGIFSGVILGAPTLTGFLKSRPSKRT